jgi:hypothetical protein
MTEMWQAVGVIDRRRNVESFHGQMQIVNDPRNDTKGGEITRTDSWLFRVFSWIVGRWLRLAKRLRLLIASLSRLNVSEPSQTRHPD